MAIRRRKAHSKALLARLAETSKTVGRSLFLLFVPAIPASGLSLFWYLWYYKRGDYLTEKAEGIATAAWIPTFGILYSLVFALIIATVWSEYKSMRNAVKKYDFDTFIDLRDEELSPVMHIVMLVLSWAVLGAFMKLKYPDAESGFTFVASLSYIFSLLMYVVIEIDDPCTGIWYIRNIPDGWLDVDAKKWRDGRCKAEREHFIAKCKRLVA